MKELETLEELKDYELLSSFKNKAFFGKDVCHYLYKGKRYNVHISWCKTDRGTSWVVSYGTGNNSYLFKDLGYIWDGFDREIAIAKAIKVLETEAK